MGESAGSVAAPVYGGLASDRLPEARITVLADGSGSYPDDPAFNRVSEAWGAGTTGDPWSIPGLFVQAGRHDPEIVFARHDYAHDDRQALWYPILDVPMGDLLARIDGNESQIESAGVDLHSFVAPGEDHTVLSDGRFYTEEVNGERFVDWVTRLIGGELADDVHCTSC